MIKSSKEKRVNIALVRGAYLNNFEGQNYHACELLDKNISITGIASNKSIHQQFPFQIVRLPSAADYNILGRWGRAIANRTYGDIQNLFGIEKYASRFDIFHTADPHYYYSYQLAKLRHDNKIRKLIVTSWETIPYNNESISVKKKNKYFVMNNADHFICHTLKAKQCLIKEGVQESKTSLIRLGIDLDVFQNKETNTHKNNQIVNILFVGRLVEEKGIMDAYKAYKKIKSQISKGKNKSKKLKIKFTIIGNGPLRKNLLKEVQHDKFNRSVTIVEKTYEEMPQVYKNADIFILPSKQMSTWEEQYGMVFLEAMAFGLPIVAYDTGVIQEIVSNAGVLCKGNDIQSLARSLNHLVFNTYARVKVGTIGKERVKMMFNCKNTAAELNKLYFSTI